MCSLEISWLLNVKNNSSKTWMSWKQKTSFVVHGGAGITSSLQEEETIQEKSDSLQEEAVGSESSLSIKGKMSSL